MDTGYPQKKRMFCYYLLRSRLGQLILGLLLMLIVAPLILHYYISNISGDGSSSFRSRSTKEHVYDADLDKVNCNELKVQISELRRIRASVNNELRDLENKRLSLQREISKQKTELESLRLQQENVEKELRQLTLNLDQMKVQEREFSNQIQPLLKAPELFLFETASEDRLSPLSPQLCTMHTCFDYSKCSLLSGFPVYVYNLDSLTGGENLNEFVKSSVFKALEHEAYVIREPEKACVFIAILGETTLPQSAEHIQTQLNSLPFWNGDGLNHVVINFARTLTNFDLFHSVNTGRAIIVQSSFVETRFRRKFDIVASPLLGLADGPVWSELPPLNPVRRTVFLAFSGQYNDIKREDDTNILQNQEKGSNDAVNSDQNFRSRKLHAPVETMNSMTSRDLVDKLLELESVIVKTLKTVQSGAQEKLSLNFICDNVKEKVGINGEWAVCGTEENRGEMLRQSTFSIIVAPANFSVVSTTVFQTRLYESLKHGSVPVILGDYVELPYSELLDWSKVVISLPKPRVTELYFLLRTMSNVDVMEYKKNGRLFWETYLGTAESVVSTVLAVLRTRLHIPAQPVREEPSVSAVSNFIPVPQHIAAEPEEETDEVLGPVEPPFPSPSYKQNFTVWTMREPFSEPGDPFHLFPYTPFEKLLPTDAKFFGAGLGFRPINKGEGGSGKEFSEALGGNSPREQFTMVMLTYERSDVLIRAITRLKGLPYLNKVVVVWNNPAVPSENLGWPEIGVPVVVVKMSKNSLNNRFLPFEAIETEAILSIDDDSHLRHDEIIFGFRVWREERDRIVGFPGRFHAWDNKYNSWLYNSNYTCEMSMVITGAAFFHKYYAYLYSYSMPQAIRDMVDDYMNCEDIAMNFLVSHITRKPPVKVTSRWTFRCPGCPQKLAEDKSHFEERHRCMNFFVQVYGYMPLLYTQYRADSILFKTRISHDRSKCFKYI